MDRASALDCRVDTDVDLIVLRHRAQNARIPWQVPLGQGRHHTAATGPGDAQANRISYCERVAAPSILDEIFLTGGRRYNDVGTKARDLETPLRIELVEPVERSRGQQMHHRTVEECPLWQTEVGDGVPEVEALHVGPVLLGVHCSCVAAPGGIQCHRTIERL